MFKVYAQPGSRGSGATGTARSVAGAGRSRGVTRNMAARAGRRGNTVNPRPRG